ncbi:MAG: T9SS type A sorting domain-containing protein [Bacteroidota bacterium]
MTSNLYGLFSQVVKFIERAACLAVLVLCLSLTAKAQTTGNFQRTVVFNEADYQFTRTLYFHVPTDYDLSKTYKLFVGYRGGPHSNAGEFRNQLSFLSDSIGAIVVCPENIDHFNNQEGLSKQLFQYSVDTTLEMYPNIDTNFIYLTGLSFGGRHAVIVSMDTDNGPIPNLRGVIPFAPGRESQAEPNFGELSQFPPACICIGDDDSQTFKSVANLIHSAIDLNGGNSFLNQIPNVGHTTNFAAFPSEMMECLRYIEGTYVQTSVKNIRGEWTKAVSIHPNPAKNHIQLSYPDDWSVEDLYLMDLNGQRVKTFNKSSKELDVSDLQSGLKMLVMKVGSVLISNRILLVR